MKSFNKLILMVTVITAAFFAVVNLCFINAENKDGAGRPYRVEAERIANDIKDGIYSESSLNDCFYITAVERLSGENVDTFYSVQSDYIIKMIDGELYRFDYSYRQDDSDERLMINICLAFAVALIVIFLIVIKYKIIKPFDKIREVPFELAKGNLSIPLKETKNQYFGRFIWGLDLLREKIEQQKIKELELHREKKTLVLALSHDIKTPLGIIELYSQSLEKGIYKDEAKKKKAAASINEKCKEIKDYVDRIINASSEDFLNFEVNNGEFYLSELVDRISEFYTDKLGLLKTDFIVEDYQNKLLIGDLERAVEVMQNIIENAVKYGDGKEISLCFEYDTDEDCTIFSVTNTGSVISENELDHIFNSFWRGSNAGSVRGSGLGLYICRNLMRKMNGDVFAVFQNGKMTVSAVFCNV